ncbi:MAG: Asp-tRNA(Asn)/Glu-tRNA(Gln) amidotransferase subunit GatA [Parachlamydiales bacterium]|nr:Asp-tRNA(Asn)/Glu-tRNA(Gln) amidotransferase subunit GatA [Parachlamydiales bacterium]
MYKLSGLELRNLFLSKKKSAEEITNYFLHRIKKIDKEVSSFLKVFDEKALKKAKELDQRLKDNKPIGKMAAIPVAIKDNINIEDEITTCGSRFLKNYKAPFSATIVKALEEEDAIIIGKTNLDEFAMGSSTEFSHFFPTKNPWNLKCVPGGSSGGSAAAVSSRMVPIAFGSDTGGSIRQPAAFCGISGFKPTYGRVSRYGLVAFASSMDQIGPFATTSLDLALTMEVIGRSCEKDSTNFKLPSEIYLENLPNSFENMKIGVPYQFLENVGPNVRKNFDESIQTLKDLGAEIIDINLDVLKYSIDIYYVLATAEASTNLARFDGIRYGERSKNAKNLEEVYSLSREEGFGAEVKRRILIGTYVLSAGYQDAFYKKAQKVRTVIINAFEKAFSKCDFVALPTTPDSAFEIGSIRDPLQMYLQDLFTISANLAGLPAASIPSGFDNFKKPLGLQLLAAQLQDVKLLQYANVFEKKTNFYKQIPTLFDKEIF